MGVGNISPSLLQAASECGIFTEDSLRTLVEMKEKELMLKQHPYSIRQLPDGRWQTYFADPQKGKRKEVRAASEEKLVNKLYSLYKEARHIEKLKMTDLYEQWLEYKKTITESENTIKRHEQHYRKYFEGTPLFSKTAADVTKVELESFCNGIIKEHNLSSKEFTNIKTILMGMFNYAVDREMISQSPMDRVRIRVKFRQIQKKNGKTQTYNTEELAVLNEYLDRMFSETHDVAFLAVKLNFLLGLRVGELVALKWDDRVDLRHLHIWKEEIRNQKDNSLTVVEHTKTHTDRLVPLVPKAIAILDLIASTNPTTDPEGFIFTRDGERITARQINYVLEKYAERNGLQTKSSHKMRKTYASNLNANGVPVDEIRELLGHSNLSTTMGYLYNPLTEKDTYERIKAAL